MFGIPYNEILPGYQVETPRRNQRMIQAIWIKSERGHTLSKEKMDVFGRNQQEAAACPNTGRLRDSSFCKLHLGSLTVNASKFLSTPNLTTQLTMNHGISYSTHRSLKRLDVQPLLGRKDRLSRPRLLVRLDYSHAS